MSVYRYIIAVKLTKPQREWLATKGNYSAYIRELIQKDMKRG